MKKIILLFLCSLLVASCQAAPTNAPTATVKSVSVNASGQLTAESTNFVNANGLLTTNSPLSGGKIKGQINLTNLPPEIVPLPVNLVITNAAWTNGTDFSVHDGTVFIPYTSGIGGVVTVPLVVSNAPVILQGTAYIESESGLLGIYPNGAFTFGGITFDPVANLVSLGGASIAGMPTYMAASGSIWQLLSPASEVLFDNTDRAWLDEAKTNSGSASGSGLVPYNWNEFGANLAPETTRMSGVLFSTGNLQNNISGENVQVYFNRNVTFTNEIFSWGANTGPITNGQSITISFATNNPATASVSDDFTDTGFGVTIQGNGSSFAQTNTGTKSFTLPAGVAVVRKVTYHGTAGFTSSFTSNGQRTP